MFRELHFWERWASKEEQLDGDEATDLALRLLRTQRLGVFHSGPYSGGLEEAEIIVRSLAGRVTNVGVYRAVLHHVTRRSGKSIPIEQTPRNLFYVRELREAFPTAKFIAMQRDPRDVLLSQRSKWRMRWRGYDGIPVREAARAWANYHPITVSAIWRSSASEIDDLQSEVGPDVLKVVRFEDLVRETAKTAREICEWSGIRFDARMLDVPRVDSSHTQRSGSERGVDPSAAERWRERLDGMEADFWCCERICLEHMLRFGYEPSGVSGPLRGLLRQCVTFPLKSLLAILLNLGRVTSWRGALTRRLVRRSGRTGPPIKRDT